MTDEHAVRQVMRQQAGHEAVYLENFIQKEN